RGGAVGPGPEGAQGESAGAPHRKARERTGPEAEPFVGMVPCDVLLAAARPGLAIQDHRADTDTAELGAHPLRAPRLGPAFAAREVNAQEVAGEAAGARGRGGLRLGLLGRGRGCGRPTATPLSPAALPPPPPLP